MQKLGGGQVELIRGNPKGSEQRIDSVYYTDPQYTCFYLINIQLNEQGIINFTEEETKIQKSNSLKDPQ